MISIQSTCTLVASQDGERVGAAGWHRTANTVAGPKPVDMFLKLYILIASPTTTIGYLPPLNTIPVIARLLSPQS